MAVRFLIVVPMLMIVDFPGLRFMVMIMPGPGIGVAVVVTVFE